MKKRLKRILVLSLAVVFLLLGVLGLVLPILQGWLFLAISLLLFSLYSPRLRAWIDVHTRRYPKLHAAIEGANRWVVRMFGAPEE